MATRNQAGFTLIELVLVLAITGALLAIALVGQSELRSHAQFDATVEKLVTSVAEARDQATSGVNLSTGGAVGTGATACPGGPAGEYVFEGVDWSADNSRLPGSPFEIDYYEAGPLDANHNTLAANAVACTFGGPQPIAVISDMQVDASQPVGSQGAQVLYVRTDTGALDVCFMSPGNPAAVLAVFASGSCATGAPLVLDLSDSQNHTSQITIDASGLAQRDN
jgi:prepilin-type N-terminal cleavage/methylation domain-containing protein